MEDLTDHITLYPGIVKYYHVCVALQCKSCLLDLANEVRQEGGISAGVLESGRGSGYGRRSWM